MKQAAAASSLLMAWLPGEQHWLGCRDRRSRVRFGAGFGRQGHVNRPALLLAVWLMLAHIDRPELAK
jgi:hypothetical protein